MNNVIVWADVETTGLHAGSPDKLLEVAAFVTDLDLNLLDDSGYQAVVRYENPDEVRDVADDFVKNMHDKTELWQKLPEGKPLEQIDAELTAYIKLFAPEARQGRLAGNSVRLDANFIEEFLPAVSAHLHYRLLDVSAVAFEFCEVRGVPWFKKQHTHRALDDIRESIAELKHIRSHY